MISLENFNSILAMLNWEPPNRLDLLTIHGFNYHFLEKLVASAAAAKN